MKKYCSVVHFGRKMVRNAVHNALLKHFINGNAVPVRSGSFPTMGTALPRVPPRNDPAPPTLGIVHHLYTKPRVFHLAPSYDASVKTLNVKKLNYVESGVFAWPNLNAFRPYDSSSLGEDSGETEWGERRGTQGVISALRYVHRVTAITRLVELSKTFFCHRAPLHFLLWRYSL